MTKTPKERSSRRGLDRGEGIPIANWQTDDSLASNAKIAEIVGRFPRTSGVYLMKDGDGEVIYIGKAKDLRNRVRNYFSGQDDRPNVPRIIERVRSIQTITTEDERQAIFLEMDLVRKFKPRYNIRLKDDKAPFLVRIDETNSWPRLELVRQRLNDEASYYGPFPLTFELRELLEIIRESIPLRTCSDQVFHNRLRPCLEYQIKHCLGPCCLPVDQSEYRALVRQAAAILEGKNEEVVEELRELMLQASSQTRFEDAANYRDRLQILERVGRDKDVLQYGEATACDAFGFYREGHHVEVSLVMVRYGRLAGGASWGFSSVEIEDEEVLEAVLTQYYAAINDRPKTVILPFLLAEQQAVKEWVEERSHHVVDFAIPQRGVKLRVLELAQRNARENFRARFGIDNHGVEACKALQLELGLQDIPRVIECVDVSHFQGAATVASVVCFRDGQPDKARYRLFHLSQEGMPNDFASMHEVVKRHLSRMAEENSLCDLLIVDGGPEQLAQALNVARELGLAELRIIGLAKRRVIKVPLGVERVGPIAAKPERIYLSPRESSVALKPGSAALNLLERLRDEAHRFAITFHRRTRQKRTFISLLDGIPGIGAKRKTELLKIYSSAKAIAKAAPQDIHSRSGLPLKLSELLVEVLNNRLSKN